MKPYPYQIELAQNIINKLNSQGLCYVCAEERTGKTLASLLAADQFLCENAPLLIVTKKRALEGWESTLKQTDLKLKDITLINYESLHKVPNKPYKLAILDEAHHAISAYPKPSRTAINLQKLIYEAYVLFLSATPSAQGYSKLFHQLNMTKYSPWDSYDNFYKWFRDYGIPKNIRIGFQFKPIYDNVKVNMIQPILDKYFISLSRKDVGFKYEPEDKIHYLSPSKTLIETYKYLEQNKLFMSGGKKRVFKTPAEEMLGLHQIEGGTLKLTENESIFIGNMEKINYIQNKWGDAPNIAIFFQYVAEGFLLSDHFKQAKILQGDAFAEGIDLSSYEHLIIYSMSFSATKYTQRRARQCNMLRDKPIKVHYLIFKNFIGEQVYNCVCVKNKNFVAKYYTPHEILGG